MISLIVPYYNNPRMLAHQYRTWAKYAEELRAQLEFIVVDDGSKQEAVDVERPEGINLKLYRIHKDVPWHWCGAKNLGAHEAEGKWLFLTDIDHVVPSKTWRELLKIEDESFIYTLGRVNTQGERVLNKDKQPKPHPNTFFMTKEMYWKVGGYDESYAGLYGTDGIYRKRAFSIAPEKHLPNTCIVLYKRSDIPDADSDLPRKEGRDPMARSRVTQKKQRMGEANVVKTLQFEWTRIL